MAADDRCPNAPLSRLLAGQAFRAANLLDVRSDRDFAAGHLRGSAPLPLEPELGAVPRAARPAWLADRLPSIYLPPRHEPLAVVATDSELAAAVARELAGRGRAEVISAGLASADLANLPESCLERGPSRHRRDVLHRRQGSGT